MTTDISLMGPHALAAHRAHIVALQSFGIDITALDIYGEQNRSLVKQPDNDQSLVIPEKDKNVAVYKAM